jgi:hypothetical protein
MVRFSSVDFFTIFMGPLSYERGMLTGIDTAHNARDVNNP